jgi:hypothetical protein
MLYLIGPLHVFSRGIAEANTIPARIINSAAKDWSAPVDHDIHVLVDSGANHCAGFSPIKGRQVSAASGEADPERSARNNEVQMITLG